MILYEKLDFVFCVLWGKCAEWGNWGIIELIDTERATQSVLFHSLRNWKQDDDRCHWLSFRNWLYVGCPFRLSGQWTIYYLTPVTNELRWHSMRLCPIKGRHRLIDSLKFRYVFCFCISSARKLFSLQGLIQAKKSHFWFRVFLFIFNIQQIDFDPMLTLYASSARWNFDSNNFVMFIQVLFILNDDHSNWRIFASIQNVATRRQSTQKQSQIQ